jgi:hypothetical protein
MRAEHRWPLLASFLLVACNAASPEQPAGAGFRPGTAMNAASPPLVARAAGPDACMPTMTRLLRSLKRPLRIEAFVTRGSPTRDSFVDALGALLAAYEAAAPLGLEYSIVEAKDDATKAKARAAGLVEQPFKAASDPGEGFMGYVVRYGDAEQVYPFVSPDLLPRLPFLLGGGIYVVRDKADGVRHKIGVLTGHGEIPLSEANLVPRAMGAFSIQGIIEQNFTQYVFEGVDLRSGDAAIHDDLEGLVITQPGVDLSEK